MWSLFLGGKQREADSWFLKNGPKKKSGGMVGNGFWVVPTDNAIA